MFNDLYSYIPDTWKFYISSASLEPIISLLNKHNISDVVPKKEDIFSYFRLLAPEEVTSVIIVEQTGLENIENVIEKIYNRLFSKAYIDIETSLNELSRKGLLLIVYPLTAIKFHRKAHRSYGWDTVIRNLIIKLLYRDKSLLHFMAWNSFSYYTFRDIMGVLFPYKNNRYFISPEYKNVYLSVGENISNYTPITKVEDKYEKEYNILVKQYKNTGFSYEELFEILLKNRY